MADSKGLLKKLAGYMSRTHEYVAEPVQAKVVDQPVQQKSVSDYDDNIRKSSQMAFEKTGVKIPAYLLAATFDQESSLGKNKANYNKDIGEYAWMMGMTKDARKDLEKKYKVDFNTPQGVFDAAALYYAERSKKYDYDPKTDTKTMIRDYTTSEADWYVDRYHGFPSGEMYDTIKKRFPSKLDYYKNNFK